MYPMVDKIDFGLWIQAEREKNGWSQSELARIAGLHRQNLYKIENGGTTPSVETFIALAGALGLSPVVLFRKAGLMPEATNNQERLEDWEYLLSQLPPDEDEELRKIAQMKIERSKNSEDTVRAAQFKPRTKRR